MPVSDRPRWRPSGADDRPSISYAASCTAHPPSLTRSSGTEPRTSVAPLGVCRVSLMLKLTACRHPPCRLPAHRSASAPSSSISRPSAPTQTRRSTSAARARYLDNWGNISSHDLLHSLQLAHEGSRRAGRAVNRPEGNHHPPQSRLWPRRRLLHRTSARQARLALGADGRSLTSCSALPSSARSCLSCRCSAAASPYSSRYVWVTA
jgi:hypothetical protein